MAVVWLPFAVKEDLFQYTGSDLLLEAWCVCRI